MKTCSKCGVRKHTGDFWKADNTADGLRCQCKDCMRAYARTPAMRLAQQRYRDSPVARESSRLALKKYYQASKGKRAIKRNYEWRKQTGRKRIYALVANHLEKCPCEVCGKTIGVQAHHDDYSKPLIVRWLCARHHMQIHKPKKIIVLRSAHDVE